MRGLAGNGAGVDQRQAAPEGRRAEVDEAVRRVDAFVGELVAGDDAETSRADRRSAAAMALWVGAGDAVEQDPGDGAIGWLRHQLRVERRGRGDLADAEHQGRRAERDPFLGGRGRDQEAIDRHAPVVRGTHRGPSAAASSTVPLPTSARIAR
jgi:hypothetical protein